MKGEAAMNGTEPIDWLANCIDFCLSHRSATAFVLLTAKLLHNLVDLLRKCRSRTDGRHLRCGVNLQQTDRDVLMGLFRRSAERSQYAVKRTDLAQKV